MLKADDTAVVLRDDHGGPIGGTAGARRAVAPYAAQHGQRPGEHAEGDRQGRPQVDQHNQGITSGE
jgi:hypothetical protein